MKGYQPQSGQNFSSTRAALVPGRGASTIRKCYVQEGSYLLSLQGPAGSVKQDNLRCQCPWRQGPKRAFADAFKEYSASNVVALSYHHDKIPSQI
eukprot:1146141-Pelagomonas_calceolata.AAC.5